MSQNTSVFNREEIETKLISVLEEITSDWDLGFSIDSTTKLIENLMFESIDIVRFVVAVEQAFDVKGLPFEKLFMQDGDYADEILVSQVVDFLHNSLP